MSEVAGSLRNVVIESVIAHGTREVFGGREDTQSLVLDGVTVDDDRLTASFTMKNYDSSPDYEWTATCVDVAATRTLGGALVVDGGPVTWPKRLHRVDPGRASRSQSVAASTNWIPALELVPYRDGYAVCSVSSIED